MLSFVFNKESPRNVVVIPWKGRAIISIRRAFVPHPISKWEQQQVTDVGTLEKEEVVSRLMLSHLAGNWGSALLHKVRFFYTSMQFYHAYLRGVDLFECWNAALCTVRQAEGALAGGACLAHTGWHKHHPPFKSLHGNPQIARMTPGKNWWYQSRQGQTPTTVAHCQLHAVTIVDAVPAFA